MTHSNLLSLAYLIAIVGCSIPLDTDPNENGVLGETDSAFERDTEENSEDDAGTEDTDDDIINDIFVPELSELIELDSNEIDFSTIRTNRTSTRFLRIENTSGNDIVGLTQELSTSTGFAIRESCPMIPKDEFCDVELRFVPTRNESYSTDLELSMENTEGVLSVELRGRGQRVEVEEGRG